MKRLYQALIGLILFLGAWQALITISQIPDFLLPSPLQVLFLLVHSHKLIFTHAVPTIYETLIGLLLGIFFGCSAALIMAFFKPLRLWFFPILIISQAIPTFVIAPLLVVWMGYGIASKIATAVLMIFFPMTSAFYDGLRRTEAGWLDLAKTMNAKKWRIFWHMRIPAALPSLASGIRIAAVIAPIGAIVGEWVGSSKGLGYLMLNSNARLQIDMMFAALIVIIILSLTLYFSVDKLLRMMVWWK